MNLFKAIHSDTDGYTYGSEQTIGVYSSVQLAEEAVERYLSSFIGGKPNIFKVKGYRQYLDHSENTYVDIEMFTVDEDWQ